VKSSGQATVSSSIDPALGRLITQQFPAVQSAGSFFPLTGLTGQTGKVVVGDLTLLARHQRKAEPVPGVDRRREYHILRKLSSSGLAPAVRGFNAEWLLLGWQPGEALDRQGFIQHLEAVTLKVATLHAQPLSGYRLSLLSLLQQYWQLSRPTRRHHGWLRALKKCQQQGEPRPLRLALLHMDIHGGNVIRHRDSLQFIDWEYASDGDVALELAAIVAGNGLNQQQQQQLTACYAAQQNIDPQALMQQMQRWQPWLRLLMASWYELRWQQSQQPMFYTLAAEAWQRVLSD
jgi:thiamine kinase